MKPDNESVNEYYADLVVKARRAFPGSSKDVIDSQYWKRRPEGTLAVKECEEH